MLTEILKITPQLDPSGLNTMENNLNGRFSRVAKKFGSGLMSVIKGNAILALGTVLIDKILNPLKEVQDSIERTLNAADQISTNAKQFGTSSGNLAILQSYGKAKGLDPQELNILIEKFQTAVVQATAFPDQPSSVRKYVGTKDFAAGFFEFVQALQKLTPETRSFVEAQVFGEKQILKSASFLQADFPLLAKQIGGPGAEALTGSIEKLGALQDMSKVIQARSSLNDLVGKGDRIGPRAIADMAQGEAQNLARENKRLESYDDLKKIALATDRLAKVLEDGYLKLAPVISTVLPGVIDAVVEKINLVGNSRAARLFTPKKEK